ncbi:hypothetical protein R1sor_017205 [Riccia sorocarpa]|uniref:Uncharacterized protein n=1 Tax=Riccia sorocarpa TaxID=122646 RepID=A0ABD3I646_9MARC
MSRNRRVREGNGYRMELTGMYFTPAFWAWFNFLQGTILELPSLEEDEARSPGRAHCLHRGYFYLPEEFDLTSDFVILRDNLSRTRLTGRISVPLGFRFEILPKHELLYRPETPFPGEDFSCAFLANGTMHINFPAGSSIFVADHLDSVTVAYVRAKTWWGDVQDGIGAVKMWGRKNVRPYSRPPLRNTPRPECATGLSPIITPVVPRYALESPSYSPGPSPGYHPVPPGSLIESHGYDPAPTPGYEPGRPIVDESPGYAPGRTGYSQGVEEKTEVSAEASSASYSSPATPAVGYSEIIGTIIVPAPCQII